MLFAGVWGTATGIRSYNLNSNRGDYRLFYGAILLFTVPFIILEIRHQIFLRKYVEFTRPATTMTEEEFYAITRKGKRHLLLLDDLVIDATDYAPYHPGGKFIIERTRGTDISKFFYGGYNLEPANNGTNYNHTNYARLACNGLIVGKLVRNVNVSLV
jgi:cytochrome b involved in lipid metabolism